MNNLYANFRINMSAKKKTETVGGPTERLTDIRKAQYAFTSLKGSIKVFEVAQPTLKEFLRSAEKYLINIIIWDALRFS